MYYVQEIVDRTFENWSTMLGANDHSFWSNSEIEMKPTTDVDTFSTTSTPAVPPAWESTVTSEWDESTDNQFATPSTSPSESTTDTDHVSTTLHEFTETASETLDDINPFSDRESN